MLQWTPGHRPGTFYKHYHSTYGNKDTARGCGPYWLMVVLEFRI